MTVPDYEIQPEGKFVGFTVTSDGLPHVQKFRRERTYFLFGIIPIWHVSEEHNMYDPYPHMGAVGDTE